MQDDQTVQPTDDQTPVTPADDNGGAAEPEPVVPATPVADPAMPVDDTEEGGEEKPEGEEAPAEPVQQAA